MRNLDLHANHRRGSERGFALLLVILILMGLLAIGIPFAISMRLSNSRAQTSLANARARYGAQGAYNHAIACLMRTQEQYDPWPLNLNYATADFFESYTVDIPAELEVVFEPDYDIEAEPDRAEADLNLDLYISPDELSTRNPRGAIWSVDVEDEQGKINLNSASQHLLKNLFHLLDPASANSAATQIISYRRMNRGFLTVSEAESVLKGANLFNSGQLLNFSRYVTVSSARPNPRAPHPINVNAAPQLVLVANMMDLRLATVQAQAGANNVGNGSFSPIRVNTGAPEGDWTLVCDGIAWVTQPEGLSNVTYTAYAGTIPFAEGDKFYFSTRRITEELARDLAAAMQAVVKVHAGDLDGYSGDPYTVGEVRSFGIATGEGYRKLFDKGHVAIGLDLMGYDGPSETAVLGYVSYGYSFFNYDRSYHGDPVEARRIIADVYDLDALKNVIGTHEGVDLSAAADNIVAALILNAFRPLSGLVDRPTAPFCFTTSDTYTITARGSVNNTAGSQLASHGIRRLVSVKRPTAGSVNDDDDVEHGTWRIDTEQAFDAILQARGTSRFQSSILGRSCVAGRMPRNYRFANKVLPSLGLKTRTVSENAVHSQSTLHFGNDLSQFTNLTDNEKPPLTFLPFGGSEDAPEKQSTQSSGNADGLQTSRLNTDGNEADFPSWPRLAYSTEHVPIPGVDSTSKSIEMWIKPGDWSDESRNYFLFDITRPYREVSVEKWDGASQIFRDFDLQNTPHENRIALFYRGATKELIFRISDASLSGQSAEVRYGFEPDPDTWHDVKAIWSGMDYGDMTLLIDGKAPNGQDGEDNGTGRYHPKYEWRDVAADAPVVITGNQIFEPPEKSTPARGTDSGQSSPGADDPTTLYGYSFEFVNIDTGPDTDDNVLPADYFDRIDVYAAGVRLEGALKKNPTAFVKEKTAPNAHIIPVNDTTGFQEKGFLLIGSEIVYYSSKTTTPHTFVCLPEPAAPEEGEEDGQDGGKDKGAQPMRGIDIHSGGFGPEEAVGGFTGVSTVPQEIPAGAPVVSISIYITENRGCPTPRYFATASEDIGKAASHFGISSSPRNYVRIGNEVISYTHKPGIDFLVDVGMVTSPGYTMRRQFDPVAYDHSTGSQVWPVYRIGHSGVPGGPGPGDAVTIIDDNLRPGLREAIIHTVSSDRRFVSFKSRLPKPCLLSKDARMLKFPCGEFNLGEFFSIGTNTGPKAYYDYKEKDANPFKMDRPAEATIDEFKVSNGDSSITPARLTQQELSSNYQGRMFIIFPNFWDPEFQLGWGVQTWPTQGYAQIGGEIIYYRTLFRHNVQERQTGLAVCAPASDVYIDDTIGAGDKRIEWKEKDQGGISPEEAGFCKDGGYLTIYSHLAGKKQTGSTIDLSDAAVQQLIDAGLLDGKVREDPNTEVIDGRYVITTEGGYSGGGTRMEMISYESLDGGEFTGIQRGLMGLAAAEHTPTQLLDQDGNPAENEEGEDTWYYPQLIANIVELQIVQRGCLGTTPDSHILGSKVTPLYHIVSTLLAEPPATDDDRLYVESNANFPHRGYLLVADDETQEIIGYTGKGHDDEAEKDYFAGVKFLRRRFGTPHVKLDDIEFDDEGAPADEDLKKSIVRLYEPRYDDRLPIDPDGQFAWKTGDINIEGNPAYLEISRTIRGARWESINWVEGPDPEGGPDDTWEMDDIDSARADSGTEIFILARIDGEPAWEDQENGEPVNANDKAARAAHEGPTILKFVMPLDGTTKYNRIDIEGDRLELRIYFKYNENYVDATGQVKRWTSPMLRGLKIGYSAPTSVYQQEEIRF